MASLMSVEGLTLEVFRPKYIYSLLYSLDCTRPEKLAYAACDYPKETSAQITKRMFGTKGFPRTKNAELFKWDRRKAFNLVRHK